ncbi:S41 family peptidase [Sphingomonas xinjiangensis]|uniref:Tail specific protease domain-containing protein n=1 Tax=Sphingomonas xinjiangensis TaxID=643568 RepID=A0A840YTR9_9SPHN|nr:S41 family peptidase [Sphingomonas xinjiangensis]MBB5713084.1 hypothetical protein [Sphingomonas xinjiangensis]
MALLSLPVTAAAPAHASQVTAAAESAAPAQANLDATARKDVIAKLSQALRNRYVFPDVGERAAARIEAVEASGAYDQLTKPSDLATRLASDVNAIAHDKHLSVWSTIAPPRPPDGMAEPPPKSEAGVTRADRIGGDIGYIEVTGFPPPQFFKRVVDAAMIELKNSKSLIIDIRRNGGGSPEAVAYFVSFFTAEGTPINTIVSRTENSSEFTRQDFSSVSTPIKFLSIPVAVLTSSRTFSGGEEFAYDIKALKRGTLIGEVTGGGANPTGYVDLGHGMGVSIPFGRAENPITKTNWEGTGVQPDVSVPAREALATALKRVGQKPVMDINVASDQRLFAPRTAPLAGSEPALRKLLTGLASGKPDYSQLSPELAATTREQLPALRGQLAPLGTLNLLKFRGPDMLGGDEYILEFSKGRRMMAFIPTPDGKVSAISGILPAPDGE